MSLGRLFGVTTLVAIVFSVGIVVGQHLFLHQGFPPAVSTDATVSTTDEESTDEEDETSPKTAGDLFSFYEALTAPPVREVGDEDVADDEIAAGDVPEAATDRDDWKHLDDDVAPEDVDGPARYTLQLSSHGTLEHARTEMDRLRRMELQPSVVAIEGETSHEHYQVRIGKFADEDQARARMTEIENEHGLQSFVTPL